MRVRNAPCVRPVPSEHPRHPVWHRALRRISTLGSVVSVVLLSASPSLAEGNCGAVPGTKLVVESGDTQEPLLKTLGQQLRASAAPLTMLYRTTGTCTLIDDLYAGKTLPQGTVLSYAPSVAEDSAWTPQQPSKTCTVEDPAGLAIDVAIAATFVSSCKQDPPPTGVGLFRGPVQGYGFVVPSASSQTALTAEEGYFAFGFGNAGQAPPWVDEVFLFGRPATKSTALTLAAAVGVPAGKLRGAKLDKSSEVVTRVAQSTSPEKTLGLLGLEVYDANRDKLKALAFKAFKQKYAYYADSTPTSFDKKNLRNGHYTPWAPTVYLTKVDASNVPTSLAAKRLLNLVLGQSDPGEDVDGLATVISKGLVPDCAMNVAREYDGGNLSPYTPAATCACFYESKVPGGSTKCASCTDDSGCNGGKCRRNVCEER